MMANKTKPIQQTTASTPKKSTKAERREQALKKAKRNKIITISVCVLVAVLLIAVIVYAVTRPEIPSRIYATGPQRVRLYEDGRFNFTDCRFVRAGRYTETADGDVITLAFVHNNITFYGNISGDILTIPSEWDSGKGHNPRLRLQP